MSSNQQEVYVCSDPHINHKNLVFGCSNWNDKSGCRPFSSREQHNTTIIQGINDNVKEDDILYCLGDWSFGGIGSIWWFRKHLKVKDIRFIFGNHDHHIEKNKALKIDYDDLEVPGVREMVGEHVHHMTSECFYVKAQDLFTWCNYYAEVKHFGHTYVLSHYAFDVWNKRHHGRMHLYGHSHNTLPDRGDRRMDVGFESAYEILGEWRPFNIKEIQSRLQPRDNKSLDHHNENTTE